ncbi:MAG: hypothetical protein LBN01_01100 [Endomicrobium sp.]|nr:hypothetical protein [Endomicrobium sp.]
MRLFRQKCNFQNRHFKYEYIKKIVKIFESKISQIFQAYSALKHNVRKLCELAVQSIELKRSREKLS